MDLETSTKISLSSLSAVPQTLLIPLVARAKGPALFKNRAQGQFRDASAEDVVASLHDSGEDHLQDVPSVFGSINRTIIFRSIARDYFDRHPTGTVVNLGCGLSNYFQWMTDPARTWTDFDLPEVIEVRKKILKPRSAQHQVVAGSLTDPSWRETLKVSAETPVHLMTEGVSMYLKPGDIRQILKTFAESAPVGSTFALDHMCWLAAGRAKRHPSVRKTQAEFHWGLRHYSEFTSVDPRIKIVGTHKVMED